MKNTGKAIVLTMTLAAGYEMGRRSMVSQVKAKIKTVEPLLTSALNGIIEKSVEDDLDPARFAEYVKDEVAFVALVLRGVRLGQKA